MNVLIAYASRYGATKGIAERIAEQLRAAGHDAFLASAAEAPDPARYDAVVLGSAAYIGHWRKEANAFARRYEAALAGRPLWLFSSGPLGTESTDAQGQDVREAAEPKEMVELIRTLKPRDHRVFFGALYPASLGMRDRMIRSLPAGRTLLPEGDFRDWAAIDAWTEEIARELVGAPVPASP